jgi:PIN domain nuclease of toxin-antitoxin system
MTVVLDTSALLAVILDEPGKNMVMPYLSGAELSVVNLAEVYTKLIEFGAVPDDIKGYVDQYQLRIRSFGEAHALFSARLRPMTKKLGLSFGDRAALTQAHFSQCPILTADTDWAKLNLDSLFGIDVRQIR